MIFDISHPLHSGIPDKNSPSLHRSFNQLLGSLDLPNDKIKEMNSYDSHKKWDILCSRSLMKVHQSPGAYLKRLQMPQPPTREILRGLEVSLRTYPIQWLHEFVTERNWLNVLVNIINIGNLSSENFQIVLQCLRAVITSSLPGFKMIINHPVLLESLMDRLRHVSMRNRALILQLLANACRKSPDGHRKVCDLLKIDDKKRQLMDFISLKSVDQTVMLATLNLIRMILISAADMSHRFYLQYSFHEIGLDDRIERLLLNESSLMLDVIEEITAYKSSVINVNQLIRDRDCIEMLKVELLECKAKLKEMERQLSNYVRGSDSFFFYFGMVILILFYGEILRFW